MTATKGARRGRRVLDPIALELLRSRVEAIAEDAAAAIVRTGVSPTATETHDLSATLLDADGGLVVGGGFVSYHWVAATNAVRHTIARYGDDIRAGDVFFANDPYSGGGLHPNDVFVERPIFLDDRCIAWVALSAHLADMGGMAVGSFAPTATDCYQEAFRSPPVRLFREGEEVTDVWDLLRTNVRAAWIVEMDLRALVAGGHVAQEKVAELAASMGAEPFVEGIHALQDLSERELRKRIEALPYGVYRSTTWSDWDDELYVIPCTLTIDGDRLIFDFEGAAPQAPHFINSQPYIIKSSMMMAFARVLGAGLPYSEGLLAPLEMRCPEGTVVHATPPAAINAGHMHVGGAAAEMMQQCVRLALWAADPPLPASAYVHGWSGGSALTLAIWSGLDSDGDTSIWGMSDGTSGGGAAGQDRDGIDIGNHPTGQGASANGTDIEIMESWYPVLVQERSVQRGVNGAGAHRSGGGRYMRFQPYGGELTGQMLGLREATALEGAAGGFPGSTAEFWITHQDGRSERISGKASGVVLRGGDTFEFWTGSSGGVGDPLDREPDAVAHDVATGYLGAEDAGRVYGVVLDGDGAPDVEASSSARDAMRADRLARADAPVRPLDHADLGDGGESRDLPLYPGIVQRGNVAYAEASGAPLAVAPDHWTDGCPVLERPRPGPGPAMVDRAYLDPRTGASLYVEAVPQGAPRSFEVSPARWSTARGNGRSRSAGGGRPTRRGVRGARP
jgi:N-methylhydantoinase B